MAVRVYNVEQTTFGPGGCVSITRTLGMSQEEADRPHATFERAYPKDRFRIVSGVNRRGRFIADD